jgi:hypothetical protein
MIGVEADSFQRIKMIVAIFLAKVSLAISGRMPFAAKAA